MVSTTLAISSSAQEYLLSHGDHNLRPTGGIFQISPATSLYCAATQAMLLDAAPTLRACESPRVYRLILRGESSTKVDIQPDLKLGSEAFHQSSIRIDSSVSKKRPGATRLLDVVKIKFAHYYFFFVMTSLCDHFSERVGDK